MQSTRDSFTAPLRLDKTIGTCTRPRDVTQEQEDLERGVVSGRCYALVWHIPSEPHIGFITLCFLSNRYLDASLT